MEQQADARPRLLIVDDEPELLALLTTYFSESGRRYEIMTAEQGADAVRIANVYRPHAVLLDILMPGGMDGVKVLRAIRAMDAGIPVVMLTGNIDEKVAKDTLTMGAFDYVPKPFDLQVLDRIVAAAMVVGSTRAWSPFGVNRPAPRPRTLTAEEIAALIRNDGAPMRRAAS